MRCNPGRLSPHPYYTGINSGSAQGNLCTIHELAHNDVEAPNRFPTRLHPKLVSIRLEYPTARIVAREHLPDVLTDLLLDEGIELVVHS